MFFIIRSFLFICKRIRISFWQWYNIHYCLANNVRFSEKKTVKFNSKSFISISPKAQVSIGRDFVLNSGPIAGIGTTMSKMFVAQGAKLMIGNSVGLSSTTLLCYNAITIGDYVNIGGGCFINDSNHHSTDWRDRNNRVIDKNNAKTAPITIGDYVFIGARCMIGKGVKIGEKSIIAAGSVVVKDIPANCIAGGNPCQVIKEIAD